MRQKVQNARNILIFFTLICFANKASSQEVNSNFDQFFVKSFYKNFRVPNSVRDKCAGTSVLLNFYVDEDFKVVNFKFSDNTGEELKEELRRISEKLDTKFISNYLKRNNINKIHLVYPILFLSRSEECDNQNFRVSPGDVSTQFNGALIDKPCFIRDTLTIISYQTIEN